MCDKIFRAAQSIGEFARSFHFFHHHQRVDLADSFSQHRGRDSSKSPELGVDVIRVQVTVVGDFLIHAIVGAGAQLRGKNLGGFSVAAVS